MTQSPNSEVCNSETSPFFLTPSAIEGLLLAEKYTLTYQEIFVLRAIAHHGGMASIRQIHNFEVDSLKVHTKAKLAIEWLKEKGLIKRVKINTNTVFRLATVEEVSPKEIKVEEPEDLENMY